MADDPLIDSLRRAHSARRKRQEVAEPPPPGAALPDREGAQAFDFSTLAAHKQIRITRAVADVAELESPFFRVFDTRSAPMTEIGGRPCINFGAYNYLGLNDHPEVRKAARDAIDLWGVSAGASRLVGGEHPYHRPLEEDLAVALGTEDCIVMVSGHATNVTSIGTLMGPGDLVLMDSLIHNSVSEGVRLSHANRMTFPHNDWAWVDTTLAQLRGRHQRVLIVVEGLYSMDGDIPDLARFIEVKDRHRAWLMVDEAHSLGVLGATGRGIAEHCGIDPKRVEIWMGTLSKTLSACGGYIAGSAALCDILRYGAPGFVFSVGLPAPVAAAARKALEIMLREPERVARLARNGRLFRDRCIEAGLDTGFSAGLAVAPVIIGDSLRTAFVADDILRAGIVAHPIIAPAVQNRQARLRFFLTSEHGEREIETAVTATRAAIAARSGEDPMQYLRK